jgi:DNA gyrase subunit B
MSQSPSTSGQYSASSISILRGLEAVQQRPGMYVGDISSVAATHHLLFEIFDNSVDEVLAGHADTITVILHEDGSAEVSDNGRGIPVDIHPEEGISAAEVAFTSLHAGGKFDNDSYAFSGGLHGVGAACTNALSDWLEIEIKRSGGLHKARFELGQTISHVKKTSELKKKRETGTRVRFKPSSKFLKDVIFQGEVLAKRFREIAYLNGGLRIHFKDHRNEIDAVYHFDGGVAAFVKDICAGRPIIGSIAHFEGKHEGLDVDVAFAWMGDDTPEDIRPYTNNIPQSDGGQHVTGFRAATSRVVLAYGENMGILKKTAKVSADDIREGMAIALHVRHPDPAFSSQTKEKLISTEARSAVEAILNRDLPLWLDKNPHHAKAIIERAKASSEAREAAKKARELSRVKKIGKNVSSASLPENLSDCSTKNPALRELYLVEGDSAGGSAKQGRDRETQAILPLRGKILNVERAKQSAVLKNNEIAGMIQTIGAGFNKTLDVDRMRYDKIVIMTDADVDGAHIATLILTFFFRQMRPLVEKGHLYIASPPLYRVRRKGEEDMFMKAEKDLIEALLDRCLFQKKIEIDKTIFQGQQAKDMLRNLVNLSENITAISITLGHELLADVLLGLPGIDALFGLSDKTLTKTDINKAQKTALSLLSEADTEAEWIIDISKTGISAQRVEDGVAENFDLPLEILSSWRVKAMRQAAQTAGLTTGGKVIIATKECTGPLSFLQSIQEVGLKGAQLSRYKGLGEMNPQELWSTTMDPSVRTLHRVTIEDAERADSTFADLMADNVAARRKLIEDMCAGATNLDI